MYFDDGGGILWDGGGGILPGLCSGALVCWKNCWLLEAGWETYYSYSYCWWYEAGGGGFINFCWGGTLVYWYIVGGGTFD